MNTKFVDHLADLQRRSTDDWAQMARARFETNYNPAVGWYIASTYARNQMMFPVPVAGRERWLFIAYLKCLSPTVYANRHVEEAHQIHLNPSTAAKLKALIMTGLGQPIDAHLSLVAERTGYPKRTVEAFEILFFNILDRSQDGAYISGIVYPQTRVVEFSEAYFDSAPVEDLLLRVAYNHRDIELVLELAGMTESDRRKKLAELHRHEADYRSKIIGNALLIAKLGLLNQPSVGLQRAIALLGASLQLDGTQRDAESSVISEFIASQLEYAIATMTKTTETELEQLRAMARPGKSYWHDEDGNVMPLDTQDLPPDFPQSVEAPSAHIVKFP